MEIKARKRQTGGSQKQGSPNIKSGGMGANGDNMWKFYSEDSPGVKVC